MAAGEKARRSQSRQRQRGRRTNSVKVIIHTIGASALKRQAIRAWKRSARRRTLREGQSSPQHAFNGVLRRVESRPSFSSRRTERKLSC